jgi:hypothetical protein
MFGLLDRYSLRHFNRIPLGEEDSEASNSAFDSEVLLLKETAHSLEQRKQPSLHRRAAAAHLFIWCFYTLIALAFIISHGEMTRSQCSLVYCMYFCFRSST